MWSSSFEGFWLLARRNAAALALRREARALTCDDARVAAVRLSQHLLRDIGLAEQCGCDDGGMARDARPHRGYAIGAPRTIR